jgi:FMN phosphatase YigB (HAD superfamily)/DNA-binding XRE family transcriptional regulator
MNGVGEEQEAISLGLRLQRTRKAAGLTQQQLCQKAKLAYSTLAKIERGAIKSPSIFTIQSIADALNVSMDTLLGNDTATPMQQKKISKSGVRFVYFDINGCLVRFFHRAFAQISADTHTPADVVETTFWHYNDAVCKGQISLQEFNAAMAKGIGVDTFDWGHYYLDVIEPIKEMHDVVTWAAQHYQVGLLSNIMPGFIDLMRAQKLLPDVEYAAIIDSSEVGAIKPEPEIFAVAQLKAGVSDQAVLLVDDSRTNVMAAEKAGWHVLWFDDFRAAESAERVKRALAF